MKFISFNKIILLVILILALYSLYWLFISFQLKTQLVSNLNKYNVSYKSLKVTGYPYRLTALIESPNLVSLQGLSIIKLDDVNINMNPIDVSKLMISTNRLMGSEKNNDSFNFLINEIQLRLSMADDQLNEIYSIANNMNLRIKEYNIQNINKIIFKISRVTDEEFKIFLTAETSSVLDSFNEDVRVILEGSLTNSNQSLNGSLQLDVIDESSNDNLFSTPIIVNNGIVSLLFIPLVDLRDLFSF